MQDFADVLRHQDTSTRDNALRLNFIICCGFHSQAVALNASSALMSTAEVEKLLLQLLSRCDLPMLLDSTVAVLAALEPPGCSYAIAQASMAFTSFSQFPFSVYLSHGPLLDADEIKGKLMLMRGQKTDASTAICGCLVCASTDTLHVDRSRKGNGIAPAPLSCS